MSPWTFSFWSLVLLHAIALGAWFGSTHPLASLWPSKPRPTTLVWRSTADFLAFGWPKPEPEPLTLRDSPSGRLPSPPVVTGGFITIHRQGTLPIPSEIPGAPMTPRDFMTALDDYDNLIKRQIEKFWTPPKGDTSSPARFLLRVSVGGIIQNSGVIGKSTNVELNRSVLELLDKLDRTDKPLPQGFTNEYEIEVELRAAP
jgi:hypothetical protein